MDVNFTDDEIREELARLGYKDVPEDKLAEFKKDLMKLIYTERSKNTSLNSSTDKSKTDFMEDSPNPRADSEFMDGNMNNKDSHWFHHNFKEDWQYQGGDLRPVSAVSQRELHKQKIGPSTKHIHTYIPDDSGSAGGLGGKMSHGPYNQQSNSSSDFISDTDSELGDKFIKRKTSRKGTNGHRIVDESFSTSASEGTAALCDIYERMQSMAMRDCECGKTRPKSADTEPPYRIKGVNRNPSVLTARKEPPHTRNLVKMKPFQRHQMYQKAWNLQPPVGDNFHQDVCRQVHNKLLKKDEIKLSHKIFVPNTYVVPSEKPRYGLRWAVRKCNQNYEMPKCGFFHEI